MSYRDQ